MRNPTVLEWERETRSRRSKSVVHKGEIWLVDGDKIRSWDYKLGIPMEAPISELQPEQIKQLMRAIENEAAIKSVEAGHKMTYAVIAIVILVLFIISGGCNS